MIYSWAIKLEQIHFEFLDRQHSFGQGDKILDVHLLSPSPILSTMEQMFYIYNHDASE